ncbi:FAD-dependent oxidoreductase [Paractinoplanes rhizophilus]|uniref:ferredoxin--NADP(+) reductase n=1 Tax=Paractinoplanes rhizophilus TaxID=1416877 RepID=A0ABW2HIN1_9ACTN
MERQLRVAVIGAGPAGIYAADTLVKAAPAATVDIFDRLPTPYGLIRYGVAPDHPRIKEIVVALHQVLDDPRVRFLGNIDYGIDVKPAELDAFYDATVIATGADRGRELDIPGIDLPGSFGAADFVSWYDGHPDVPGEWPLTADRVAVIGAGNVAIDVARILAKTAAELLETEIPDNVHRALLASPLTDVHIFARRGPAHVKFTPMELRELDESPNVEVIVDPDGFEVDEDALRGRRTAKMCVEILRGWAGRPPAGKPRRVHLHFGQAPVAILGDDRVTGLRTTKGDWAVGAVYRAIGYRSRPVADLPFDPVTGTIPHEAGRVLGLDGAPVPGRYATGWIKRGPVGLIGHTRKDAKETVTSLLADLPGLPPAARPDPAEVLAHLARRGLDHTTWAGWQRLDRHEIALGEPHGRRRIKVVPRAEMIAIGRRSGPLAP